MKVICYLSCGYPSVEKSIEMAEYYIKGGCDAIEISIPPKNPYRDGPFIQELMRKALAGCSDYDVYLKHIKKLVKAHPEIDFFLLLYHEVIMSIGAKKVADFYNDVGIKYVISGDLEDEEALAIFEKENVRLARAVNYSLKEEDIQKCISSNGFTYMFTSSQHKKKEGFETLDKCIDYLRERKVSEPIYCGGGINTPEHAVVVKDAGANGFFVGSSIIKLYDQPEKLVELIAQFKQAVSV